MNTPERNRRIGIFRQRCVLLLETETRPMTAPVIYERLLRDLGQSDFPWGNVTTMGLASVQAQVMTGSKQKHLGLKVQGWITQASPQQGYVLPPVIRNLLTTDNGRSAVLNSLGDIGGVPPSLHPPSPNPLPQSDTALTGGPSETKALRPLNLILYGPPGTGKTYSTINKALEILDLEYLAKHSSDRPALKRRFDDLANDRRIEFVTFHQSFAYEDFVEGIRATTEDDGHGVKYRVEDGVFKTLCKRAETPTGAAMTALGINEQPRLWKVSVGRAGQTPVRDYCFANNEMRIGWGEFGDIRTMNLEDPELGLGRNDRNSLRYFWEDMQIGDIVVCIRSATEVGAVGVITGDYAFEKKPPEAAHEPTYGNVRKVRWLVTDASQSILRLNGEKAFTQQTVYPLERFGWTDLQNEFASSGHPLPLGNQAAASTLPHVLIIDEINRGNVSRIFGELITLIEDSKRKGRPEQLSAVLPYSKQRLWVPKNLYLIGTMNTADRSLAQVDIALRRRFEFKEMPPDYKDLDFKVETVHVGALLRAMNDRIEALLDRDHCIGHTYFLDLKRTPTLPALAAVFCNRILPLLDEYFFEDRERIGWVLNDQHKAPEHRIVRAKPGDLTSLFGQQLPGMPDRQRWELNQSAFEFVESFRGIVSVAAVHKLTAPAAAVVSA